MRSSVRAKTRSLVRALAKFNDFDHSSESSTYDTYYSLRAVPIGGLLNQFVSA